MSHVSTCMSLKDTWQAMCPLAWKVQVKEVDQFVERGGGGGGGGWVVVGGREEKG